MPRTLQEEEAAIDQQIADELVELTPESWRSASIEVTYSTRDGVEKYSHVISSPEGNKEPIDPSERLFALTHQLGQLFRRHGKHWKRAKYEVRLQEDGDWKYTVDFDY
jgi:hypothetical protein